jgi:hypothetical protein
LEKQDSPETYESNQEEKHKQTLNQMLFCEHQNAWSTIDGSLAQRWYKQSYIAEIYQDNIYNNLEKNTPVDSSFIVHSLILLNMM